MSDEHKTRKLILNYIGNNPGATFLEMMKVLEMNRGTLRYHVRQLRRSDEIILKTTDGKKRYYRTDAPRSVKPKDELVMDVIRSEPGIERRSLLARSKCDRKSLSQCIQSLRRKHLVFIQRENGGIHYWPIAVEDMKWEAYKVLVRKLLDGEIDEERFNELEAALEVEKENT